jgi:hypothetical protein
LNLVDELYGSRGDGEWCEVVDSLGGDHGLHKGGAAGRGDKFSVSRG